MRRVAVLVGVVLGIVFVSARPAAAHGGGGVEATNYETTVEGFSPPLPGAHLRVLEAGERVELRNNGPEVVVFGYGGEPYLRVGPDGVFENRRSPTVARNREQVHPPAAPDTDPDAAPDWQRVAGRTVARWHDHRVHWRGADPQAVQARPGTRQVVQPAWAVPVYRGDKRAVATGQLTWVPGPSPAPWFAVMAAAFAGVAALGLALRGRVALTVVVGLLLGIDVVHAVGSAFASAGGLGSHLARVVTGNASAVPGWALALVALGLLARGRVDGLYAAVFAGLSIAVFGGLLDLIVLSRSVTLFVLPIEVARLCIALALGGGTGLVAASLLVIRRTPEARIVLGGGPGNTGLR